MTCTTSALLTDSYQLAMLQSYYEHGFTDTAVFELFVRRLPSTRDFLVAAGIEQVLEFLENLAFTEEELSWLARGSRYGSGFLSELSRLRFTGDVDAMPEGTLFRADEPVVQVTARLPQAQLIESRLINLVHFETLIASKAARCVLAAPGKLLVDFGLRRAHGAEAGLLAARASYLAGFDGTSTVLAGKLFGIPVYGTMAHSFIEAHASEMEAFEDFAESAADPATLLIDTYDTEEGARRVARLAPRIGGVRIDSGDLAAHARKVRDILDQAGLEEVKIFASSGLDETEIRALLEKGAPIDGFGVGTRLTTSSDAPYLDCAYKLEEYAGIARRKSSEGKATWPGRKQVYRFPTHDLIALRSERIEGGEPLLQPVMRAGRRLERGDSLARIRERVAAQLSDASLLRRAFPVRMSTELLELASRMDRMEGRAKAA